MNRDYVAVAALTLLALLLRAWGLGSDLWLDEITTVVDYMRLSPLEAAGSFNAANQHLLNSVLGSLSIRIFGETEWSTRLPAMLFGVATIPVFFLLARVVTQRREALFSTVFMTLNYHHVWFSQNARGYSAMIFFTVLSTLFLLRALDGRRRRDWLWFGTCSGLGMLALLNYAFVLAGQFLAAVSVTSRHDGTVLRRLFGSGVLAVVVTLAGYAGTLPAMLEYFSRGGSELGWQNPLAFAKVFAQGLTRALPAMAIPALLAAGAITLVGWVSYLKQQRFVALMLVLPAAFNVLVLIMLDFGTYPRSFLYIMPFGILVAMRGAFVLSEAVRKRLNALRERPWVECTLPSFILAAALIMLPYNYLYPKQDYTGALEYARTTSDEADVIAAVGYLASGYRSYYAPELAFPATAEELAALSEPGTRVWVLYSFTRDMRRHFPDIQDYMEEHFEQRRVFPGSLGDGDVYVVVSKD